MNKRLNTNTTKKEMEKTDVDKLKIVPVDLSKLRNIVNHNIVKKTLYNNLVEKVNNISTSKFF